ELDERELDSPQVSGKVAVGVRRATEDEVKAAWPWSYGEVKPSTMNVLAIKPSGLLKADRAYDLRLRRELPAAEGELGLSDDRVVGFETWYTFRVKETPAPICLPGRLPIAFSNPVRQQDLYAHMTVQPSTGMPELDAEAAEWTGSIDSERRKVEFAMPEIGWKPDTAYAFTIDGKLKDIYGNALGADFTFAVELQGYCPTLKVAHGFGVLESYLPQRHPVQAVNLDVVPLQKAVIPEEQFVPFYRKIPWSCGETVDLTGLPGAVTKPWDLKLPRNSRLRTFISMEDVLGPGQKGGFLFAQVQDPDGCWVKVVDNVTRLGLTVKDSLDSTLIWTTFLRTGAPARDVAVEIRDDENKVLWQGRTDKQGFADAPGWKGLGIADWKRWNRPTLWVIAREPGGPAALATDWRSGLSLWRFNINAENYPRPDHYEGFLFSERGIYRPGETVYLKGLLRTLERGDWALLGAKDPRVLRLSLRDPRGAEVVKTTVTLSAHSSFDFSHALAEGSPTGTWTATVTELLPERPETVRPVQPDEEGGDGTEDGSREYIGQEAKIRLSETFRVEAFKPASFEVKVVPAQPSYVAKDTYTAVIDGWYLFGAPMTDAPAEWKLRLEPSGFTPPGYDDFDFSPGWWRHTSQSGRMLASASGKLDAAGKLEVRAGLDPGGATGPLAAVLEAGVSSPERQRLFGRAATIVHRAELYFGIRPAKTFMEKGQPWKAEVVAVRPDGVKAAGIAAEVKMVRRDWLSARRAGLGGRLEWVTEQRDVTLTTFSFTTDQATFTWTFTPTEPGQYFMSVSGVDESSRPAEAAISFYVVGGGDSWWAREDNDIVELVPDKKAYKPGDTARILVKSPYAKSRVLVTLEREGVLDRWITELRGGASFIDVPLKDKHVPNVFVGVMLVQGRAEGAKYDAEGDDLSKPQSKFGYAALTVDPGGRRLVVKAASDRKEYRPRDPVTVSLSAMDEKGRPWGGAELTVFAVDEGVLALTGYATPDPFQAFYGPRPLLVATADNRPFVIGQRSFGEKGERRGGGGGDMAGLGGVDLRSRFIPTAYWNPSVETDAQGKAVVRFSLPDNLSRFRVMAVAHAGKRFGSGEARFTVSKPLLLRPSLPRLSRTGDAFEGGVVVHNYSAAPATVTVEMSLSGESVALEGPARQEVFVLPNKAHEIVWKCRAVKTGKTAFRFRAMAGKESDGLEWVVPVLQRERLETVATSGVTDAVAVEELQRPKDSRLDAGAIQATLSPTALAGLQAGAKFLLEYPYGCLEQRLSRMLPVIVGADLTEAFGLGTVGDLKGEVQKGLNRLSDFQHPTGGFGYWTRPYLPDPYVTAYALEVAALAGKEGYLLPKEVLARAVAWLKTSLTVRRQWAFPYNEEEEYAARGYALYALALHGEPMPGVFQELYARRDQISFLARAYLLKAAPLLSSDPAVKETLAAEMLNQARLAPRSLHFEEPSETRMPWVHESTVKTTALCLQALLEARGGFSGDEKAVQWLVGERKAKGRWRTTQENAASLHALQDFYRRYEKAVPDFFAEFGFDGGAPLWTERFAGRTLTSRGKGFSPAAVFAAGDKARLRFAKAGTGRLYYSLGMSYVPADVERKSWEGFEIEKSVTPLYGGAALKAGARAVVKLTIRTKQDRTFVAIDDPLPAGFEIVDPTFAVEGREDARALSEAAGRGQYWGTFYRSENYDDRILVFADFLTKGEHKYAYLVQATTPGEFHAPSTWVEAMYEPEVFGRTASGTMKVER
ncbi:MAG: hypothetical protein A2X36_06250, partial [Elusimicrobia bacterium GWA2_69_24]